MNNINTFMVIVYVATIIAVSLVYNLFIRMAVDDGYSKDSNFVSVVRFMLVMAPAFIVGLLCRFVHAGPLDYILFVAWGVTILIVTELIKVDIKGIRYRRSHNKPSGKRWSK